MRKHVSFRFRVLALLLLFFAGSFALSASRSGNTSLWLLTAAVPGVILFLLLLPSGLFPLDRPSLAAGLTLCGLSILAPVSFGPEEALSQALRCAAALFFLFAGAVLLRIYRPSLPGSVLLSALSLGLLSLPLWLPGVPLSPGDGASVILLLGVVSFLSLRLRLPALLCALCGLFLFLLRSDPVSGGIWTLAFILLFWASSGSSLWTGISLCSAGGLFIFWILLTPLPDSAGASVFSRLSAMSVVLPESVPESILPEDSLFLLLGEQYGLLFLLSAVLLAVLLLIRGASLALQSRKQFHASAALGVLLLLGIRALAFLLNLADLLPLPAGSFPFLSLSPETLCTDMFFLGILSGISARNEADLSEDVRLSMLAR